MTNLIDISYFIGERDVPNTTYEDVSGLLNHIIVQRQREYLVGVMGYDMYLLFEAGLAVVDPVPVDPIWLFLRDGGTFENYAGVDTYFGGIANNTTKESPLADYVYYWWLRQTQTHNSGVGVVQAKVENANVVTATNIQAEVWNRMARANRVLREALTVSVDIYPAYVGHMGSRVQMDFITPINAYNI